MAPPAKKQKSAAESDGEEDDGQDMRNRRSPTREGARLHRYQHHTVKEALGLGGGRQKHTKTKFTLEDDLKIINYLATAGVKKYGGAFSGYAVMMGFSLEYPEVF